jgi:asparagine synthase (glutamine-hydrolysing)
MYAQWSVFELVKQHGVKVVLDGQGSDEQLAGYHGFFGNRFYDLLTQWRLKKMFEEMRLSKQMHGTLQPLPLLLNKLTPDFLRQHVRKILGKSSKHSGWCNTKRLGADKRDPLWGEPHRSVLHQSLQQLTRSSLPMLLHYEDRNSMAHSVESRTPFLDYRLVEFTLGLPSEYKISNGWTKRVLREGMKGIMPDAIRHRIDKLGFVTAEEVWMCKEAPDRFRKAVVEAVENSGGILQPRVYQTIEEILQGRCPFNFMIWRLISFGEWMKRFKVRVPH